jgi:hypothetical protein
MELRLLILELRSKRGIYEETNAPLLFVRVSSRLDETGQSEVFLNDDIWKCCQ